MRSLSPPSASVPLQTQLCLPSQEKKAEQGRVRMQWRTTRVCVLLGAPKVSVHCDVELLGVRGGKERVLSCFLGGKEWRAEKD